MLQPKAPADSLIQSRSHRFARLYRMVRPDMQTFRFTDHDTLISYEGAEYVPAGGFSPTATRMQDSLHAQNFNVDGALTSAAITQDDLRRGYWRDTEVTEYIVDWMYPSAGAIKTSRYWITELEWDGEVWQATFEGGARWLRTTEGFTHTRNCRWKLGQGLDNGIGCSVNLGSLTLRSVGVASVTSRTEFTGDTTIPGADTRERYRFGRVIWVTGNNVGSIQEIADYRQVATRVIELFEPTPFDIVGGDDFDLEPGCDKIRPTCITEYANLPDFGGFPYMPGTNKLLLKPTGFAPPPPPGQM